MCKSRVKTKEAIKIDRQEHNSPPSSLVPQMFFEVNGKNYTSEANFRRGFPIMNAVLLDFDIIGLSCVFGILIVALVRAIFRVRVFYATDLHNRFFRS